VQREINNRYSDRHEIGDTYEQAVQIDAEIKARYGELRVQTNIRRLALYNNEFNCVIEYKIDSWVDQPPQLIDLLSVTINAPLASSAVILTLFLVAFLIERDYKPTRSVLTLLRMPQPRCRYLHSKLISPAILMLLFWGLQLSVAVCQRTYFLSVVPEALRTGSISPWLFDFYRILYPVYDPVWFPATVCALCMIPLSIISFVFITKGGLKSWVYGLLPVTGVAAVILTVNRVSNMWWITPVILAAVYINSIELLNKGQIV